MNSKKKILGVDFDDVLVKSGQAMADFHNERYGTAYSLGDVKDFDLSKIWNCTPEEARARIDEFVSTDFHHNAEAVFGAYEALQTLSDIYDVVIITGRREQSRDVTLEWLQKNFLGLYRELHFTSHDDPDPSKRRLKSDVVRELGIDVFIDDALKFAEDVASLGVPVYLFDTPWNQGAISEGITRVYSWSEIVGHLMPRS